MVLRKKEEEETFLRKNFFSVRSQSHVPDMPGKGSRKFQRLQLKMEVKGIVQGAR